MITITPSYSGHTNIIKVTARVEEVTTTGSSRSIKLYLNTERIDAPQYAWDGKYQVSGDINGEKVIYVPANGNLDFINGEPLTVTVNSAGLATVNINFTVTLFRNDGNNKIVTGSITSIQLTPEPVIAKTYTVTYNKNNIAWDKFPENQTKTEGKNLTLSAIVPEKEPVAGASTSFTITGHANGGDKNTSCIGQKDTYTEYDFIKWNTAKNGSGTSYNPSGVYSVDDNVTLYVIYSSETNTEYSNNSISNLPKPTRSTDTDTYTISFDGNGGTVDGGISSETATKTTSYSFNKWTENIDGSGASYSDSVSFMDSRVVYAQWNETSKTTKITLPTATRTGYTFVGWSESRTSEYFINGNYTPTKSLTLYAQWSGADNIQYKINHHIQDLNTSTYTLHSSITNTGNTDEELTISSLYNDIEGFTFKEGKVNGEVVTSTNILGDGSLVIDLYYSRNTYKVTLTSDNDGVTNMIGDGSYKYEESVSVEVEFDNIYHFVKWTGSKTYTKNPTDFTMPANDVSLSPTIELNTYNIEFNSNGGTGTTSSMSMTYNESKSLTANGFSKSGYSFIGWNTVADGTGASYTDKQTVSNLTSKHNDVVTLYAQWTANAYEVEYDANGGTGAPATGGKQHGQPYTISDIIPVRPGYDFKGWGLNSSDIYPTFNPGDPYTDNTSITLYAIWTVKIFTNTINHILTGFVNGDGNTNNGQCYLFKTETFEQAYGTSFILDTNKATTDIPNGFHLGNKIKYEYTNLFIDYNLGSKVNQDKHDMVFNYYYDPDTFNITYILNGGTNPSNAPTTYNVLYGVTLKQPTKIGCRFDGWSNGSIKITAINGDKTGSFANVDAMYEELSSRTTGNITLTANWTSSSIVYIVDSSGNLYPFQCFIYKDGNWTQHSPYIVNDGNWTQY